jgi:hypothetical protein
LVEHLGRPHPDPGIRTVSAALVNIVYPELNEQVSDSVAGQRAGDGEETPHIAGAQRTGALALDVAHLLNDRPRGPAPTRSGRHQGPTAIVRIDDPRDPPALLEAVKQTGERRRAVQQMSLQLTNGVRLAIGEQGQHVRLSLGDTDTGKPALEKDSDGVRGPLKLDNKRGLIRRHEVEDTTNP